MLSTPELKFMQEILNNEGKIDTDRPSLTLDEISWLNRYVDFGYWQFGLNITCGWLTDAGHDFFIESIWDNQSHDDEMKNALRVNADPFVDNIQIDKPPVA